MYRTPLVLLALLVAPASSLVMVSLGPLRRGFLQSSVSAGAVGLLGKPAWADYKANERRTLGLISLIGGATVRCEIFKLSYLTAMNNQP